MGRTNVWEKNSPPTFQIFGFSFNLRILQCWKSELIVLTRVSQLSLFIQNAKALQCAEGKLKWGDISFAIRRVSKNTVTVTKTSQER